MMIFTLRIFTKIVLPAVVATILTLAVTSGAVADYPEKSINYIIPFGPGGESDITARHQQLFFKRLFGKDLVISYKPGGGGAVGWAQLNAMSGDGYTIMGINLPHIIIKPRQKNVGFKTENITSVYMFHYTPDAIVVSNNSSFKTLKDMLEFAKNNPKKLIFSGSGKGTANHLAQVSFDQAAQISSTYVPFKGTGAALQALLGDNVMAQWGYTSVGAKHADKVRLLAVATEKRHPRFPDVPTFKELGYDIVSGAYRGIAVPKSTPENIRRRLSDMIAAINANPEFRSRMENDGMALLDVDYDDINAFIAEKIRLYTEAAKRAGVIK